MVVLFGEGNAPNQLLGYMLSCPNTVDVYGSILRKNTKSSQKNPETIQANRHATFLLLWVKAGNLSLYLQENKCHFFKMFSPDGFVASWTIFLLSPIA